MHALILLAVLGHAGSPLAEHSQVTPAVADVVEKNACHDEAGRHVFDQFIFYRWDSRACRFQVAEWRLVKTGDSLRYDRPSRMWIARGRGYEIRARAMRETNTQYDPELREREYLPQEQRDPFLQPTPIDIFQGR